MNRFAFTLAALAAAAVLAAAGGLGYWVLIHPANPLTAFFSGKVSVTEARVITGPYPSRADLEKLRAAGVETVVCLLDPAIPYEKTLLEAERKTAEELGMRFLDFPMGSILGRRFGEGYERNAAAAAEAVKTATGKVYLHCYLGMHRIKVVRALLERVGEIPSAYVRGGERTPDALALDRAQAFFEKGRFDEALAQIGSIKAPDAPALLLRGWSLLRLGRNAPAGDAFTAAFKANPEDPAALLGLGLARKRQGRASEAAALFKRVLAKDPGNREAREALGL